MKNRLLSLVLLVLCGSAIAQANIPRTNLDTTRITPYDYACSKPDGTVVSGHQRWDTAFEACWNNVELSDFRIKGGEWAFRRTNVIVSGSGAAGGTGATSALSVNCVVSDWGAWIDRPVQPEIDPMTGEQQVTQDRYRTVLVAAANGGTACPGLTESQTITVTHPIPPSGTIILAARDSTYASAVERIGYEPDNPDADPDYVDGIGAFRILCAYSHMEKDDPLLYPGVSGGSHAHVFVGNTGTDADSTASSILNSGSSTCDGGIANRSGYWAPCAYSLTDMTCRAPHHFTVYYKSSSSNAGRLAAMVNLPNGIGMIAGNPVSQTTTINPWWDSTIHFYCDRIDGGGHYGDGQIMPACNGGDYLVMNISFPACWDGENLTSPNFRTHLAYPRYSDGVGGNMCPPSHSYELPHVEFNPTYIVPIGENSGDWRLSSDKPVGPAITGMASVNVGGTDYIRVTTASAHGFSNGDAVRIRGVTATGSYDVNGDWYDWDRTGVATSIKNVTSTTFDIPKTVTSGSYTSGGTASIAPGLTLHADLMIGWQLSPVDRMDQLMDGCVRTGLDCHRSLLGDRYYLLQFDTPP